MGYVFWIVIAALSVACFYVGTLYVAQLKQRLNNLEGKAFMPYDPTRPIFRLDMFQQYFNMVSQIAKSDDAAEKLMYAFIYQLRELRIPDSVSSEAGLKLKEMESGFQLLSFRLVNLSRQKEELQGPNPFDTELQDLLQQREDLGEGISKLKHIASIWKQASQRYEQKQASR